MNITTKHRNEREPFLTIDLLGLERDNLLQDVFGYRDIASSIDFDHRLRVLTTLGREPGDWETPGSL